MQASNINQNPESNPQAIIVAGKMGHGKSSFIRMLVRDEEKQKIQCGQSAISITNECYSYQMSNQAKTLLNIDQKDQIFLIDTPGLDSLNKNYLIIEQIKFIIYQKKCDIIGIIYIRSLSDTRQFDQENKSSLVQFHKIFPVKKEIKNKISLFVMTRIDNEYDKANGLKKKRESIIKLFTQQQVDFIATRRVEWASQSYDDPEALKEQMQSSPKLKKIFDNQWIQLGRLINESRQIKYSNIQFNKQNSLYEQAFCTKIKQLAVASEEKCKTMVTYKFQTPEITTKQTIQKIGFLLNYASFSAGAIVLQGFAITALCSSCVVFVPLIAAVGLLIGYTKAQRIRKQKIDKSIKQQVLREKTEDIYIQELHKMAKKSVELLFLKQIIQQTNVQANLIQFPRKQWCRKIEIKQIVQGKQISLKKCQSKIMLFPLCQKIHNLKDHWTFKIQSDCKYVVEMTFQIPTEASILKVIKSVAKQVYYDQFENNEN